MGSAAIQIANLFDCIVIAVAGDERKLELCRELGADHVFSYREESISQRVKEITGGVGADIVFEHVGHATWTDTTKEKDTEPEAMTTPPKREAKTQKPPTFTF